MNRKIIIDCDPGIDDAVALCIALFDPRVDLLAITPTAGTVDADQATANVTAIVGHLDPPRFPRIGKAIAPESAPVASDLEFNGSCGLGEFDCDTFGRQHQTSCEKIISEMVHQYPDQITLVCLGPLTNLARLIRRDPVAVSLVDKVVISGGAVNQPGNATATAEHNMYFDPTSAAEAFASLTTKSLVPLDVTESVGFGVELIEKLPSKSTRAGAILHQMLPFYFRTFHRKLGRELIPLHDAMTLLAVCEPEIFSWKPMAGKVETSGELTRGQTIFDRRLRRQWPLNMEVATGVDPVEAEAAIVRSLRYCGQQT